ncbi:MAG: sigma-70 family RNA polymerase sigma factor [bacterium]|nr:sigma-70 family RNA polymerase sigma factor [bacterium]
MQKQERSKNFNKISRLIQKGEERGHVTYEDLDEVFTDKSVWSPHLEDLLGQLEEHNITVIDGKEEKEKAEEGKLGVTWLQEPVKTYLSEIGRIPVLDSEEEIGLAKTIEQGKESLKQIEKELDLSIRRIKRLFLQRRQEDKVINPEVLSHLAYLDQNKKESILSAIDSAEKQVSEAKQKFTEANLRLVVSIAKKYVHCKVSFLDLVDEGNLGLMRAVDKFDYKEGFRFSTYATWWIRQSITRALANQARTVRIPVYMAEMVNKCIKTTRILSQELGREPTLEEIAAKMKLPVARIVELVTVAQEPASLETPVGSNGVSQLGDMIEDKDSLPPHKAMFFQILKEQINKLLTTLSEKEERTLRLRYGLDEESGPHTLGEIGDILGVTRERVRQLENKALSKLRKLQISKELQEFFLEEE